MAARPPAAESARLYGVHPGRVISPDAIRAAAWLALDKNSCHKSFIGLIQRQRMYDGLVSNRIHCQAAIRFIVSSLQCEAAVHHWKILRIIEEEPDFLKIEQILVPHNQTTPAEMQRHGSSTSCQINVSSLAKNSFLKCCLVFRTKNKTLANLQTFLRDYGAPSPSLLERQLKAVGRKVQIATKKLVPTINQPTCHCS